MSDEFPVFAAKAGDLLHEARAALIEEEFENLLVLIAATVSRLIADQIEAHHMRGDL